MTAPYDQQLGGSGSPRTARWAIHAQDEATRFTAEKRDGPTRHIVAMTHSRRCWTGWMRSCASR